MGRDVDDFGADEFFSYRGKFTATRRADHRIRFDNDFLMRKVGQEFFPMADLFLAFMRFDGDFRFRSAGLGFRFGFVEQAHLFYRVHDLLGFRFTAELSLAQPFDLLTQLFVLCFQRLVLRGQFIDFPLHFLFTDICHTAPQPYEFAMGLLYHKTAENPSVYTGLRLFYMTNFGVIFCTARGCSIDRPSMSQRNCCGVSSRTSSGVFGHCSRPFSIRL